MYEARGLTPGKLEDLSVSVAWEEGSGADCVGTSGGGGGVGKPDDVAGPMGLGASACLRWL